MLNRPWLRETEPFAEEQEWETEAGTHVETGGEYLVKPKYIDRRLPAECIKIQWVPLTLPGGDGDNRDSGGGVEGEIIAYFRFDVPGGDEYDHMDGKQRKSEAYNLDFVVGTDEEIRRDRSNCNTEPF